MNDMIKLMESFSVTKEYKSGSAKVAALKEVSLSLSSGDFVSIVGPSGAGKSTLLHVMGGLEPPSRGRVIVGSRDLYKMADKELSLWRRKNIGFIFQLYHLIEELNVLENIALASFKAGIKYSFKKVEELLQYLGIKDRIDFFPHQLSGGQKQKVAVARALINDPLILLCDEPTGNLDKESQNRIVDFLDFLNREKSKTILLVTHNLELAKRAKRVLFIENGELK